VNVTLRLQLASFSTTTPIFGLLIIFITISIQSEFSETYTPPSHISTVNQPHAVGDHVCPVAGYQTAVRASHQLGGTSTN